jgi:hypothetical protein
MHFRKDWLHDNYSPYLLIQSLTCPVSCGKSTSKDPDPDCIDPPWFSNAAFPMQGAVRLGSPQSGREGAA